MFIRTRTSASTRTSTPSRTSARTHAPVTARSLAVAAAVLSLLAMTGCGSGTSNGEEPGSAATSTSGEASPSGGAGGYGSGYGAPADSPAESPAAEGTAATELSTAETSVGTIVVDGTGMTVYQFDTDEQGGTTSACTGPCAVKWPAVSGTSTPRLRGVTAKVGTITGVDGKPQLTLDGWPVYYYAGDSAPGDVNGQGVGGIWWALSPTGSPIRK